MGNASSVNKPLTIFRSDGEWPRHSEYILKTGEKLFLMPAPKAELEFYKPFDDPDLLTSFLAMANGVQDDFNSAFKSEQISQARMPGRSNPKRNKLVRSIAEQRLIPFCNHYGLFGIFWHYFSHWQNIRNEIQVLILERGFMPDEFMPDESNRRKFTMPYDEYASLFHPFGNVPQFRSIPKTFEDSFLRGYGEPVEMMLEMLMKLRFWNLEWKEFFESKAKAYEPKTTIVQGKKYKLFRSKHGAKFIEEEKGKSLTHEKVAIRWMDDLECSVYPVEISISYDLKRKAWLPTINFLSLIDAVAVMFVDSRSRSELKACEHCKNPFFAINPKSEYCSQSHANNARVTKSKKRKRARNMLKKGVPRTEISRKLRITNSQLTRLIATANKRGK